MKKSTLIRSKKSCPTDDFIASQEPVIIEPLRYYHDYNSGHPPMRVHEEAINAFARGFFNFKDALVGGLVIGFAGAFWLQFTSVSAQQARLQAAMAREQAALPARQEQGLLAFQQVSSQNTPVQNPLAGRF